MVRAFVRVLVIALILPLATTGTLPLWAQLAGVEGTHVCHCSIEKHDCICPKCNPDHGEEMLLSSESLKGRCGEDQTLFGGKAIRAVLLPTHLTLAPIAIRTIVIEEHHDPILRVKTEPPTPPPRSIPTRAA